MEENKESKVVYFTTDYQSFSENQAESEDSEDI